ncbi:unnamed protein product [Rangifer tarandus platyrhynchus]|uniref:Uncharacterized protein n=3 Tax=Rangifer tarandus platyrhynchus TaxID=3082113 RepID=A0ABN8ZIA3_RANTA|nr:unnamed protein product [Rangifer tarandus platyrhynchus]CAI9708855.1 unnamed protein product [Rangifer tarandus platyrhynchus]
MAASRGPQKDGNQRDGAGSLELSLPPAPLPARLSPSPPARSALGPAARAAPLQGGGETASGRPTPSSLLGRDPEAPEGPRLQPRLALRPPGAAAPKTPPAFSSARAAGTRGHTWAPPPGARRARMGPR